MRILLFLVLGITLFGSSMTANACSYLPMSDYETGKKYAYYFYSGPNYPDSFKVDLKNFSGFISLVRAKVVATEKMSNPLGFPETYTNQTVEFDLIENIKGTYNSKHKKIFPEDPKFIGKTLVQPNLNFAFWENIRLPEQITSIGQWPDSCGTTYDEPTVSDGKIYMILGANYGQSSRLIHIARVDEVDSDLVEAFRLIANDVPEAPHKLSPAKYFSQMQGFSDINVIECPGRGDFKFEDSRFAGPERQLNKLYTVSEAYNAEELEFRDVMYFNGGRNPEDFKCNFGDRFLVIHSEYPKFLKVDQGRINISDILTDIVITGSNSLPVEQVKTWIKEGGEKTATNE